MRNMSADGYAPKSASKPFRLLKQALKWGMAQDLITKNPCDFCKPPKRVKTPINALPREERTHMLELARRACLGGLPRRGRGGGPHQHPLRHREPPGDGYREGTLLCHHKNVLNDGR